MQDIDIIIFMLILMKICRIDRAKLGLFDSLSVVRYFVCLSICLFLTQSRPNALTDRHDIAEVTLHFTSI